MTLVIRNARVLTLAGDPVRRGSAMGELGVVDPGDVVVDEQGVIAEVRAHDSTAPAPAGAAVLEARGRLCMPAFVDCHTHACWAGDRLDEWEAKQRGATYLELLKAGGGIMSTVRAVRSASEDELVEGLLARLEFMLREGTTTVEVKSGYGLTTADELKMLRAIRRAGERWAGTVIPTACIGHALDPEVERDQFVRRTVEETLPAVHVEFPDAAVDAYCEEGAWSLAECLRLFDRAAELGHVCRVHADQFNALGMTEAAVGRGFRSVDHLEATGAESLRRLAASDTFGVMLPCSGFHTDGRYADGRGFIEAGGALAIATNCNPGSAPTASMPMAIALATRFCGGGAASNCARGISSAEAICAATVNGAAVLGLRDRGRITPGARADLVLLRHSDERMLGQEFGGRHVDVVVCAGRVVG
ncbi:MAG: imidazolonepropionase [Phycisphaerales bacterium JB039]